MIKWIFILFFTIESVIFVITNQAYAGLINGNFETSDFYGWDTNIGMGALKFSNATKPVGTIDVIDPPFSFGISSTKWDCVDGTSLARITTRNGGMFDIGPEYSYITISQSIELAPYDTLSGTAFFLTEDYLHQDSGWVKILDEYGDEVATPWIKTSGNIDGPDVIWTNTALREYVTQLTQWTWDATIAGTYTLVLGMQTRGDNEWDSHAYFDNITQTTRPTPEPTTTLLIGAGLIGIFGFTKRKKRTHSGNIE